MDLNKNAAYMHAVDVTEMRVMRREDGWLLMLKGERRGEQLVSFMNAARFSDALVFAATAADCGYLTWYVDKYPKK